jgi:hypothetical protein
MPDSSASWQPPHPGPAELRRLFPAEIPLPSDKSEFQLALALGGTVSAGAYTAGVVDFLVEALDAWTRAREDGDPLAPPHRVVVKLITGASGGGVNASIATRSLSHAFPPVHPETPEAEAATNPFYDAWVNRLDIAGMLDTGDLAGGAMPSLLNVAPLDGAAQSIVDFQGDPLGSHQTPRFRRWLDDTLTLFVTLTNLRGVPYQIDFEGVRANESYVDHADWGRFAADTRPGVTATPRPDEFGLSNWRDTAPGFTGFSTLGHYALGTAAFPGGFVPRELERPLGHYAYRIASVPGRDGEERLRWLRPDWNAIAGAAPLDPDYRFPVVDGGAIDNEPFGLARTALAGPLGRNPRDGFAARRAVLLIDPFTDPVSLGPQNVGSFFANLGGLLGTLIAQGRYDTADLALAADSHIFSRFMISAVRGSSTGGRAIASGGFNAFMGFFCRDFRRHDFLLGRRNAYQFLRDQMLFPEGNPIFDDWTVAQRRRFRSWEDETYGTENWQVPMLPLIPLMGSAAAEPPEPRWPTGAFDPDSVKHALRHRIRGVANGLETQNLPEGLAGFAARLYLGLPAWLGEGAALKAALGQLRQTLVDWQL